MTNNAVLELHPGDYIFHTDYEKCKVISRDGTSVKLQPVTVTGMKRLRLKHNQFQIVEKSIARYQKYIDFSQ